MESLDKITLLIPTYERQSYFERIFEYHKDSDLKIIIADSTIDKFIGEIINHNIKYYHFPGIGLPQKLAKCFDIIDTKYVVMCSDDDFIIIPAIHSCIKFLENNNEFSCVQGNCLFYKKKITYFPHIEMNVIYKDQLCFDISQTNPFERVRSLFSKYRTLFTAIHYTKNLQYAFTGIDNKISNLFLNEYLTGIIPIMFGKYKELPIFYQIREYDETSDGHTAINLDSMMTDKKYEKELNNYTDYVSNKIAGITMNKQEECKKILYDILHSFSTILIRQKLSLQKIVFSKRIGNIISQVPFGEKIILKHRLFGQKKDLKLVIRSKEDKKNLEIIKKLILKYGSA